MVATGAGIISLAALGVSLRATRHSARSATATERQAAASEAALPKPPPAVEWRLEWQRKSSYALRNVGTDTATNVRIIVPPAYVNLVRFDLGDGTVGAGSAVRIMLISVGELDNLTDIAVAWDGHLGEIRVPVPR